MLRPPPTSPLFPYTTLFRSTIWGARAPPDPLERPLFWSRAVYHHLAGELLPNLTMTRLLWSQFAAGLTGALLPNEDRKSTRLNSSHVRISYAVFCLKKKNKK